MGKNSTIRTLEYQFTTFKTKEDALSSGLEYSATTHANSQWLS